MRVLTVVGARPQFVKAAVVSRAMKNAARGFEEVLVHTGQHYDANMSDVFFDEMRIPRPHYALEVKESRHGAMTARMLEKLEDVLLNEKPDVVLVYGDTNSTLAGALAAVKLHIPVAHVEAGLRSFNRRMPEEINRVLTDHASRYLFCPTDTAIENLKREGIEGSSEKAIVAKVGDVMFDAVQFYRGIAKPTDAVARLIEEFRDGFFLATIHRAENTDDLARLEVIAGALRSISEKKPIVFPVHPRTRKVLVQEGIGLPNVTMLDPVGYFDMISLLSACTAVLTDSGGLQKEAFFFRRPCVTLRTETEWVELVALGVNLLAGDRSDAVVAALDSVLAARPSWDAPVYGSGHAADELLQVLAAS